MEELACSVCKENKPEHAFAIKVKSKGRGRAYKCKACKNDYNKLWYKTNKSKHVKNVVKNNKIKRNKNIQYVRQLKSAPCTDCGNTYHPVCMDFDHLDSSKKEMSISKMATSGRSKQDILREIAKCELVCSNCHRLRTHLRLCSLMDKAGGFYPQD